MSMCLLRLQKLEKGPEVKGLSPQSSKNSQFSSWMPPHHLTHCSNTLQTNSRPVLCTFQMHTCGWKKWQCTNDSLPLKDQGCFDAMKCSYKQNINHSCFVTIDSPQIAPNLSPTHQPTERNTLGTQIQGLSGPARPSKFTPLKGVISSQQSALMLTAVLISPSVGFFCTGCLVHNNFCTHCRIV